MNRKLLALGLTGGILLGGGLGVSLVELEKRNDEIESYHKQIKSLESKKTELNTQLEEKKSVIKKLSGDLKTSNKQLKSSKEEIDSLKKNIESRRQELIKLKKQVKANSPDDSVTVSRGKTEIRPASLGQPIKSTKVVTAYTAGPESTGKSPGDPDYGKTSSGIDVFEGVIALGKDYPMGTIVRIPGIGWTITLDRGGAIHNGKIDVYMPTVSKALDWGRPTLEVEIYPMPKNASLESRVELVKKLRRLEGMSTAGV
ncbi:lytic transglycosylase [Bacillus phage SP-15]|uniref:Lytic transglycosylase n=1 Tax=Bacillus phage SP-15 TaxID=1792032 RepID=A0A127AW72_9CAUD|nr:lytic transglycosylase [Bacillus phage SP-15]AMM44872.1 lytic transglycosylase [Bacillus phage SP-15]